jgi:hypothetical protein
MDKKQISLAGIEATASAMAYCCIASVLGTGLFEFLNLLV